MLRKFLNEFIIMLLIVSFGIIINTFPILGREITMFWDGEPLELKCIEVGEEIFVPVEIDKSFAKHHKKIPQNLYTVSFNGVKYYPLSSFLKKLGLSYLKSEVYDKVTICIKSENIKLYPYKYVIRERGCKKVSNSESKLDFYEISYGSLPSGDILIRPLYNDFWFYYYPPGFRPGFYFGNYGFYPPPAQGEGDNHYHLLNPCHPKGNICRDQPGNKGGNGNK